MAGSSLEVTESGKQSHFLTRTNLLLVVAAVLYCLPLFSNTECYGRRDWDQSLFRAQTPRVAILRDHQLPLWNPYVNGGTVLLAHPHCPAASPWYLFVLVLGAPLGLRVQVVAFMALGSTGMATLLRRQGLAPAACLVAGIVFMMSSHFALHITEGHLEWCVLGLMPWVMIPLSQSPPTAVRTVITSLLLASVLLFGSVYIMAVFVPFLTVWAVLESARRRSPRLLLHWAGVLVLTCLLSAVKLLPQLDFTTENPRETIAEGYSLSGLPLVFLEPRQALLYQATRDALVPDHLASLRALPAAVATPIHNHLQRSGFEWAWHEYGCYITYLGLILVFCGVVSGWKRQWPLYVAGLLALLTSLGHGLPLDLWALMQRLPLYESLHVPSRFLAAVVFVLAVASGCGLDALLRMRGLRGKFRLRGIVQAAVPLAIWLELAAMGWKLFDDIFVICTPESEVTMSRDRVAARPFVLQDPPQRYFPVMTSDVYSHLMDNRGILVGYENMAVKRGQVRLADAPDDRGMAWIEGSAGTAEISKWTMAQVTVHADVDRDAQLVLNQNYASGWKVRISDPVGRRTTRAERSAGGLVSTQIGPYDRVVEFYYRPRSVIWGTVISSTTLLFCCGVFVVARRCPRPERVPLSGRS
jgi:hypothetical protein